MRGIALWFVILAALANTSAAHAHASLIRSEPADRAVLAQAPAELKLTFNEPVSPLVLRLVRPGGEVNELKDVAARGATIAAALPAALSRGTHLLSWRVISADGHPVGGALTFSIGQPGATPKATGVDDDIHLRGAIWVARFVLYICLFAGVGGVFYSHWIAGAPLSRRVRSALTACLACGLIAALLSVGLHGADVLGARLSQVSGLNAWTSGLTSAYGLTLGIAVGALALGLAAMAVSAPLARWMSALALVGVGTAIAASGHAATAGPELVTRPAIFLHGVSVAFWVGALLPLGAALRAGAGLAELKRFSKVIPLPLVALIASGVLLAIVQVRQLDALWTTSYGMVLSGKLASVAVLLAIALFNRQLTPRVTGGDSKSARRLVWSIQAELAIVVVILALVATWRFTPPPRSLLAASVQPVHAHIHADRAMADLEIQPAGADGRRITVSLLDVEFRPLAAKEVTLVFSTPDSGIEPLRVVASQVDSLIWRVDGMRLPMSGRWHVRVEILVSDFEKIAVEDEVDLR